MELYDAIRSRRSVRAFEDRPVPRECLGRLLEAAREAPSAKNLMPWKLVVLSDPAKRAAIAASGAYGGFIATAPLVLVACGDTAASPAWYAVDTAIALEHVALAAAAEGLGSCWVGSFDEALVKSLLSVPAEYAVVALLALGYPKARLDLTALGSRLIHPTKKLEGLVAEESFASPWKD